MYENIKGLQDFMTWLPRYYKVDLRTITLGVPPQEVRRKKEMALNQIEGSQSPNYKNVSMIHGP